MKFSSYLGLLWFEVMTTDERNTLKLNYYSFNNN